MPLLNPLQLRNLNAQMRLIGEAFRIPPPRRLSDWADEHFYLSASNSSISGPWKTLPYQRAIMDAGIANDDVKTVTFAKSARVGYTKMNVAAFAYFIAHKKRGVLMYLPTEQDAIDTVRTDIDPALQDCPPLRAALRADPDKKRAVENTRHKKMFHGAVADILGGTAAKNYRRHTKDVVFYDELDAFDEDIQGEGSPLALGDKRLETSSYPKSIRGSTMGISGQSLVERELEDADWTFRRELPCLACGDYAPLRWRQFKYDDNNPDTVRRECEACGYAARYKDYKTMDARGIWRTDDGVEIREDTITFHDSDGNKLTPRSHIAFRIWAGYSYFAPWPAMVAEWIAANRQRKSGDLTRFKAFINLWLGEAYEQPGTKIDHEWLMSRRETYSAPAPDGVLAIVAGVDIQADRIELEYMGVGEGEETWSLDYVRLYGDTTESAVYEQLDEALNRRFEMEGRGEMGLSGACVDSGYQADLVYAFCKTRQARGVFAIKGYAGFDRPWLGNRTKAYINGQRHDRAQVIPVGVDLFKELVLDRLHLTEPGPGYCHFPMHYGRDYFEGLTAEKLQPKRRRGFTVNEFVKIRARNEPFDTRVYAMAALRLTRAELTNAAAVRRSTGAASEATPTRQPQAPDRDAEAFDSGFSGDHDDGGFLDGVGDDW